MTRLRRIVVACAVALLVMGLVATVGAQKKLTFVMAVNAGNIPYWVPGRIGAMDAGKDLGVNVEWLAPPVADVNMLISYIENVIERKVDGIALAAPNWETIASTVEKIRAAGIPVISVNNPLPGMTYVGQEHVKAGEAIARELIKALSGEGDWAEYHRLPKRKPQGKVVFYIDVPGQTTLEQRMQGYKNGCKDYPAIEFVNVFDVTTRGSAFAKRVVEDAMTRYPDLAGHASTVGIGTAMAGQIVKEKGLVGKCVVVGWDLLPQTLELIQEGVIAATVGQNPYGQGYMSIKLLYDHVKQGKPLPPVLDTGAEIVTIKNVGAVIEREDRYLKQ